MVSDASVSVDKISSRTSSSAHDRRVARWLFTVAGLVVLMIIVGGATRLTGSGLSIVEWRPVTGVLPPLSEAQWAAEFAKYQDYPEFQKVNQWMTLADFRQIYWLEYIHRLLGRLIGAVFLIPFAFFWLKRYLRRELALPLAGIFILGGLQGALGWFMVQSGLVDVPAVSHYRLAAHLALAVVLYLAMMWIGFGLWRPRTGSTQPGFMRWPAAILLWLVFGQMLLGALVAGLDAGFIYTTWPKMGEGWFPADAWALEPMIRNLFDNPALVQFEHRIVAYGIVGFVLWLAWRGRRLNGAVRTGIEMVVAAAILQAGLGIATLTAATPVVLGVLHQAGGVVLLTAALYLNHALRMAGTQERGR